MIKCVQPKLCLQVPHKRRPVDRAAAPCLMRGHFTKSLLDTGIRQTSSSRDALLLLPQCVSTRAQKGGKGTKPTTKTTTRRDPPTKQGEQKIRASTRALLPQCSTIPAGLCCLTSKNISFFPDKIISSSPRIGRNRGNPHSTIM